MTPQTALEDFLYDLKNANKSPRTIRTYRSDLKAFISQCPDDFANIDTVHLRRFFSQNQHLKPATSANKHPSPAFSNGDTNMI